MGLEEYIAANHSREHDFRAYRKAWHENVDSLLFVLIETLSNCNLECPMCIHSVGYDKSRPMKDPLFERVATQIEAMNVPSVCMNQVNEPLLDKKIFDRIKRIAAIPSVVDIMMNTNAVLLNRERSRRLLDSGLTRLLIGLDAFSKTIFEKMRTGAKYDQVMKNVLGFLEEREKSNAKFPVVRLSFVRTSENEHELGQWIEFWKDKVDYLSIQEYLSPVLDDTKNYLIPQSSKRSEVDRASISCEQPFERAVIRGDGGVLPCCAHFATKIPIGNILSEDLSEIWAGAKLARLRKIFKDGNWEDDPICGPCLRLSYGLERTATPVRFYK